MTDREGRARLAALAASAMFVGVVAWPVRQNWAPRRRDDFPLSYYPMFSARRRKHGAVVHPVAVWADGSRHDLPYRHCGTGGFNQVRRQLARQVSDGRAQQVADALAARLVRSRLPEHREVVRVEVVTGRYRYEGFFRGERAPVSEVVHAGADLVPTAGQVAV